MRGRTHPPWATGRADYDREVNVASPPTVAVLTAEPLTDRLAGPAIRARAIATEVARAGHRVSLLSTSAADGSALGELPDNLTVAGPETAAGLTSADVVIVQGRVLLERPELATSDARIVVDLYDPFHLEALFRGADDPLRRVDLVEGARGTLTGQLRRGDHFLCASERQRDFWLGWLAAAGRLNPSTHAADPTYRSFISVAPFGIDDEPPAEGPSPLRAIDGIDAEDPIVVWAGGLHEWLDPVTVVRAVARVARSVPNVRLVLLGSHNPATIADGGPSVSETATAAAAAVTELELDEHVFFHGDWVPFAERGAVLLDAAVGVLAQERHIETQFSFRTRLLDHLWAGLPTVSTHGDGLGSRLQARGAASLVEPGDDEAMAAEIVDLLTSDDRRATMAAAARAAADNYRWSHTLAPLLAYLAEAPPAADLANATQARLIMNPPSPAATGAAHYLDRARRQLDAGGPGEVLRRSTDAARRRLGRG